MARLIYSAIASADGYVEDAAGSFEWAAPDEEVLCFVNDLERPVGTYLYGRRMYRTMVYWETADTLARPAACRRGLHRHLAGGGQDRVLQDTRVGIERQDADRAELRSRPGPAAEVGARRRYDRRRCGSRRAGHRGRAGRRTAVCSSYRSSSAGASRRYPGDVRLDLDLLDTRRFANGTVFLRYRPR